MIFKKFGITGKLHKFFKKTRGLIERIGFSRIAIILVLVIIVRFDYKLNLWNTTTNVIAQDVNAYYAYLPSVFIYNDLTLGYLHDGASVGDQLVTWPKTTPEGKKVITALRGSVNANHNSWSGVLYDGKTLYKAPTYQITHIVDRVGGGDSFMGGLIYGLITYGDDLQSALDFAVAASCLKHTIYGDYNRVSVSEVEKLMGGDSSGRVSR